MKGNLPYTISTNAVPIYPAQSDGGDQSRRIGKQMHKS